MKTLKKSTENKLSLNVQKASYRHLMLLLVLVVCLPCARSQEVIPLELTKTGLILTINTDLGTDNISFSQICGYGPEVHSWLELTAVSTESVQLSIKTAIPNPASSVPAGTVCNDCSTLCTGNEYVDPDNIHGCYKIRITIGGQDFNYILCIYGKAPLRIEPNDFDFLSDIPNSQSQLFSINRDEGTYNWEIVPNPGPLLTIGTGANYNANITFTPNSEVTGNYSLRVTGGNPVETTTATLNVKAVKPNGPKSKDLVFLIDISGSMELTADCPPDYKGPKLGLVKFRLNEAKDIILGPDFFGPNDRFGFVTFESTATKVSGNTLRNKASFESNFNTWVNGMSTTGCTSMGDGLKKAIEILGAPEANRDKYIILLTNGMQNTSPMVKENNDVVYIDDEPDIILNPNHKIITFSVFQPSPDYVDLLKKISEQTAGVFFGDICEVRLDGALTHVQSSNSPKTIVFREASLNGSTGTESFSINEKFDKLIISVATISDNNITFNVEKNIGGSWQDFSAGKTVRPSGNSPHRVFSKPISAGIAPEGEYRVKITSSKPDIGYRLTVIIDDRGIKHYTYSGKATYRAGDSFLLSARLSYLGSPIPNNQVSFVKAYIRKPDFSFTNEFSKKKMPSNYIEKVKDPEQKPGQNLLPRRRLLPPAGQTFESTLPIIEQKFQILQYETDFMDKLTWSEQVVNLQNVGNGIYRGSFNDTKLTGFYDIKFEIEGNHSTMGSFNRTEFQSVPVLFSTPILEKSKLLILQESPMYITFTPMDKYDNLLGPGKVDVINIQMTSGSHGGFIDYFNGKYAVPLHVPANADPIIIVKVYNDILYKGPLSKVPRKKSTISLWGGYANPAGTFNNNYNPGYSIELKYNYNFKRAIALNIEGGYYSFSDQVSDVYPIYGGAAGLKYLKAFGSSAWHLYVDANGGYYKPQDIDGAFGVNAGVSLIRYFRHWLSGGFDFSYYKIFTSPDQIDFVTASLGLQFHF